MSDICPYRREDKVERSKKLLASAGFDLSKVSETSVKLEQDSWFNISCKELGVKSNSFWKDLIDEHQKRWGKTPSEKTFKSKTIRIYPTLEQKQKLKVWLDHARLLYNTAVNELQGTSEKSNKFELRNKLVTLKNTKVTDQKLLEAMKQTPKEIRSKAVFEACAAHDLSIKKTTTLNPKYAALQRLIKQEDLKLEKHTIGKLVPSQKKNI